MSVDLIVMDALLLCELEISQVQWCGLKEQYTDSALTKDRRSIQPTLYDTRLFPLYERSEH